MPEMRGDEFLEYLKHNELFKQIPVVMLSSEDSTSERIRCLLYTSMGEDKAGAARIGRIDPDAAAEDHEMCIRDRCSGFCT